MSLETRYVAWAEQFSEREHALRSEILSWLPSRIVDFHTHANGLAAAGVLPPAALNRIYSSFPGFSVQDSVRLEPAFFGQTRRRCLRFSNPYKGIDIRRANDYLLENSRPEDRVVLCAVPDDVEYTLSQLSTDRYVALKSYAAYFEPPSTTIAPFFPDVILQACETKRIPIILHLPSSLPNCLPELLALVDRFPSLPVVLAHVGRVLVADRPAREAFRAIAAIDTVYCDTSAMASIEVFRLVLSELGEERILYGSDEPMHLLRYSYFQHPSRGVRVTAAHPYHWLPDEIWQQYGRRPEEIPHMHWQSLVALRQAIESELSDARALLARDLILESNAVRLVPSLARGAQ